MPKSRKAKTDRIINDADGRKGFADILDTTFLKAGRDASFNSMVIEHIYLLLRSR
jgi:hypothetical protein